MGFFDSEVVQQEARQLFEDYQSLTQLGSEYGKFDREGKIIFIDRMEELMERYKIFMKRFELSEDFSAQMVLAVFCPIMLSPVYCSEIWGFCGFSRTMI